MHVSLTGIFIILTSVNQPIFPCGSCIPPIIYCVNDNEGAMKTLSPLVARIIHTFVHSS